MSYILSKLITKLESKDQSIPVVVTDIDGWIDDRLISEIKKAGWDFLVLNSLDDEFFVMIEAEKLKKQGKKVIVDTKKISLKDFVYLAEYCDRGNKVDLYAKKIAHELGVDTKEYPIETIVDILTVGLFKDEAWWKNVSKIGIDAVFQELEDKVWDLIKDPSLWEQISEKERELIIKEYLPRKFGFKIRKDLEPAEISDRLSERIFESYFIEDQSDEVKNEVKKFYEKWEDSKEMEKSLFEHAEKFEKARMNDLIKNRDRVVSRCTHPFFKIEKELFEEKVKDFLDTQNRECVEFAKSRSKSRDILKDKDVQNGIYWNELAQLGVIYERKDLSKIDSLDGIIDYYRDFIWKFDRLDRILEISHLPSKLVEWAKNEIDKVLRETDSVWSRFYDPGKPAEQAGLIQRIFKEDGKQAVVVVDALRYELAASIDLERFGIEKKIDAIVAMTPTVTPIGMGALFSSGCVKKEQDGNGFFIVDSETGKRISDVKSREENIQRLVNGVEIYPLGKIPSKPKEKLILTSRDVDEAGHNDLLKFISEKILDEISKTIKELIRKGYTVHVVSDHGFCLLRDEDTLSERKDDSFYSSGRYKLSSKRDEDLKSEKIGENCIDYAGYGKSFEKNGSFYHGGISIQEVLIPHAIFKEKSDMVKLQVSIFEKEKLKILRKKRANVVISASNIFLDVKPRKVYVEVKNERFDSKKNIKNGEQLQIPISFEASDGEEFKIVLRDSDDGTYLDSVKVTYRPIREDLF